MCVRLRYSKLHRYLSGVQLFDLCPNCQKLPQTQINERGRQATSNHHHGAPSIQACFMVAIANVADPLTAAARRGERYNGKRPNYHGRRFSRQTYPDPTLYGWTFTGRRSRRVFFLEKVFDSHGVIKLDFYYTTGTVKTVLDHPRQGVSQLFAKGDSLSPDMYLSSHSTESTAPYRKSISYATQVGRRKQQNGAGIDRPHLLL